MRHLFLFTIIFFISSCYTQNKYVRGIYVSKCLLYGQPEYIIYIPDDSTYIREYPYLKGVVWAGKWIQKSDSIFMTDIYEIGENTEKELITELQDSILQWNPIHIYIKKKDSLIEISPDNNSRQCKLIKVLNKQKNNNGLIYSK